MLPLMHLMLSVVLLSATAAPPAQWWKGNTHTHTLWSDGNAAPEHVADWYVRNGYHFLEPSDHNVLSVGEKWMAVNEKRLKPEHVEDLEKRFGPGWVVEREREGVREMQLKTLVELRERFDRPGEFLFIQGEEITDRFRLAQVHINGLNLEDVIPPQGGESVRDTIQRNIDAVIAHGKEHGHPVLAHLNHPNFRKSLTPEDVAAIRGERFFEVYNGHRGVLNHGDGEEVVGLERLWDVALTLRLIEHDLGLLYGVAVDDAHDHHGKGATSTPGRGWVWVHAPELTPDAIVTAMRAGDFYSSSGVRLEGFGRDSATLWLEIAADEGVTYTTEFIGTRMVDDTPGEPGEVLATSSELRPTYTPRGDELYVRARVTSSRLHPNPFAEGDREMAWIQPVVGPASP
jgi:hypothetical protein